MSKSGLGRLGAVTHSVFKDMLRFGLQCPWQVCDIKKHTHFHEAIFWTLGKSVNAKVLKSRICKKGKVFVFIWKVLLLSSRRAGAGNRDFLLNPYSKNATFEFLVGWSRKSFFFIKSSFKNINFELLAGLGWKSSFFLLNPHLKDTNFEFLAGWGWNSLFC